MGNLFGTDALKGPLRGSVIVTVWLPQCLLGFRCCSKLKISRPKSLAVWLSPTTIWAGRARSSLLRPLVTVSRLPLGDVLRSGRHARSRRDRQRGVDHLPRMGGRQESSSHLKAGPARVGRSLRIRRSVAD